VWPDRFRVGGAGCLSALYAEFQLMGLMFEVAGLSYIDEARLPGLLQTPVHLKGAIALRFSERFVSLCPCP